MMWKGLPENKAKVVFMKCPAILGPGGTKLLGTFDLATYYSLFGLYGFQQSLTFWWGLCYLELYLNSAKT